MSDLLDDLSVSEGDDSDLAKTLEELDDLDAELFGSSFKNSKKAKNTKDSKQPSPKEQINSKKNSLDDFDDDDLADLLSDDDEGFTKGKHYSKETDKKISQVTTDAVPESGTKLLDTKEREKTKRSLDSTTKKVSFDFSEETTLNKGTFGETVHKGTNFETHAQETEIQRKDSIDFDDDDDAELFKSLGDGDSTPIGKKAYSPIKKPVAKKKEDIDFDDTSDFLQGLGLDEQEVKSSLPAKNLKNEAKLQSSKISQKRNDNIDFDDSSELLEGLGFDVLGGKKNDGKQRAESPQKKRSFMEDLLGGGKEEASPTKPKTEKFSLDKKYSTNVKNDKDDDFQFGSYVPSSVPSGQPRRRRSVKFEDDVQLGKSLGLASAHNSLDKEDSYLDDELAPKSRIKINRESQKLSENFHYRDQIQESPKHTGSETTFRRSQTDTPEKTINILQKKKDKAMELLKSSKETGLDWLGVSKEKEPKNLPRSVKDSGGDWLGKAEESTKSKQSSPKRRDSEADWLGFSESKSEVSSNLKQTVNTTPKKQIESIPPVSTQISSQKNDNLKDDHEINMKRHLLGKESVQPAAKSDFNMQLTGQQIENSSLVSSVISQSRSEQLDPLQTHMVSMEKTDNRDKFVNQQVSMNPASHFELPLHSSSVVQSSVSAIQYPPSTGQIIPPQGITYQTPSFSQTSSIQSGPLQQFSVVNEQIITLQSMLTSVQLEREELRKSIEAMKRRQEEDIKSLETSKQNQKKTLEETYQQQESRLKNEYESRILNLETKIRVLESEKTTILENHHKKIEELQKEHKQEVQRLKDLHFRAISAMKQDHEEALTRLKQLKDQEVEAISSSQVYARSLQHITDQLEARAADLGTLQSKVEDRHQMALQERQALLDAKEKELRVLQTRLHKQLEEGDEERIRLQQLVLRLENRLQKDAREGEEERWDMQQTKAKLEVQRKILDEEQKLAFQQIEREKEKLRLAQDSLLHEQKTVLLQLAQERQQLATEKMEVESLAKRVKEEEIKLTSKRIKDEAIIESQRRSLQQEKDKLYIEREYARQENQQLQIDREAIERERRHLTDEEEKLRDLGLKVKRRSEEVEEMCMSAVSSREEGKAALASAHQIELDHQARIHQMTQQLQILMDKEKQILLEKAAVREERMQLDMKRDSILCANCKLSLNHPITALPPAVLHNIQTSTPLAITSGNASINARSSLPSHLKADPSLLVWYFTAQKDKEYLQDEFSFLQSLKQSSVHSLNDTH